MTKVLYRDANIKTSVKHKHKTNIYTPLVTFLISVNSFNRSCSADLRTLVGLCALSTSKHRKTGKDMTKMSINHSHCSNKYLRTIYAVNMYDAVKN